MALDPQPCCTLDNSFQDGLQLKCGAADDAKHVTGRSLVFKRFLKLALARLFGFEQSRVLVCLSLNGLPAVRRMAITPMASPARIKGTPSMVRSPGRCARSLPSGYSAVSACKSAT